MKTKYCKILSGSFKWMCIIVLGYIILIIAYHIGQGVDRCLDLGDGYVIGNLPGKLDYWPSGNPSATIGLLDQHVVGLLATDNWIIGKTQSYWFSVDKVRHRIYYPISSEKELSEIKNNLFAIDEKSCHVYSPLNSEKEVREITGMDISPSKLMTKFPPLSFWWPSSYEYKYKTTILFVCKVGAGYVIIVLTITIIRLICKRRSKLNLN